MGASLSAGLVAFGDTNGAVLIYDTKNSKEKKRLDGTHQGPVSLLQFSPVLSDRFFLVSAGCNGRINVYDVATGFEVLQTIDDSILPLSAVQFCRGHRMLAVVSQDNTVFFYAWKYVSTTLNLEALNIDIHPTGHHVRINPQIKARFLDYLFSF